MTIPVRFAPILFGALLSAIMVAIVSGVVLALNQGIQQGFLWQWLRTCAPTRRGASGAGVGRALNQGSQQGFLWQWRRTGATPWPVAFPTVTLVAPWGRRA